MALKPLAGLPNALQDQAWASSPLFNQFTLAEFLSAAQALQHDPRMHAAASQVRQPTGRMRRGGTTATPFAEFMRNRVGPVQE